MSNQDNNMIAVVAEGGERIARLLLHFGSESGDWSNFESGSDQGFLETVKMDLVMLASTIESRIQELGQSDQDFGT